MAPHQGGMNRESYIPGRSRRPARDRSGPPNDGGTITLPVSSYRQPRETVVIVVSPATNADQEQAYSRRGPLFDAEVGGRVVVERSTTPFLDGARRLVEFGHDGKAMLVMKHLGTDAVALRAKLAAAAGFTVDEHGIPRFKRWKPWGDDAVHASNDTAQPGGSNHAALLALRPLRARARAEINAIDREADSGFLRAPLRALVQAGPGDRREVWDG